MKFSAIYKVTLSIMMLFVCNLIQANEAYLDDNFCCQPCDCCCQPCKGLNYDIDFNASYLYWSIQEDQLGFAIENLTLANLATTPSKIKTHHPQCASGIRLEEGIYSKCNPIGCRFGWTYFQTHSPARAHTPLSAIENDTPEAVAVTTLSAPFSRDTPFLFSQRAKSKWGININEFVFDIEHLCCCGSCISFRPYVGIIGACIDQKQKIFYEGIVLPDGDLSDLSVSRKNNFCGIGPRFGLGFNWNFCNKLSLVTNANAAYLVGRIHTKNRFVAPLAIAGELTNTNEKIYRGRPMACGSIGLEWKEQINNCAAICFSIAYEFQYWWQQWHSSSNLFDDLISGEGRWGDLSMHGLVVTGGVSF